VSSRPPGLTRTPAWCTSFRAMNAAMPGGGVEPPVPFDALPSNHRHVAVPSDYVDRPPYTPGEKRNETGRIQTYIPAITSRVTTMRSTLRFRFQANSIRSIFSHQSHSYGGSGNRTPPEPFPASLRAFNSARTAVPVSPERPAPPLSDAGQEGKTTASLAQFRSVARR